MHDARTLLPLICHSRTEKEITHCNTQLDYPPHDQQRAPSVIELYVYNDAKRKKGEKEKSARATRRCNRLMERVGGQAAQLYSTFSAMGNTHGVAAAAATGVRAHLPNGLQTKKLTATV